MKHQKRALSLGRQVALAIGIFALLALFMPSLPSAKAASPAYIRVIHASPDIGTVDVFVDGNKLLSSFQFGSVTGYVPVPEGSHMVQIALIGKGVNAAVITQTVSITAGNAYTVAGLGTNALGFSLDVFNDNNVVSGSDAKLRVYHLSPGTGSVNVSDSSNTVVQGLAYPQASNYVNVPAGAYTFNVDAASSNVSLPVSATLKPWTVTSVFAVGLLNGSPKIQLVTAETAGIPGLPGTGSDPRPVASSTSVQLFNPWMIGLLIGLVILLSTYYVSPLRRHTVKK